MFDAALLVGTWKLDYFTIKHPERAKRDWGEKARGIINYFDDGKMSVYILKNVPNKSGLYMRQELSASILYYSGVYRVEDTTVIHKVLAAADPNRIGKEERREMTYEPNTGKLTLTATGRFGEAKLVWKDKSPSMSAEDWNICNQVIRRMQDAGIKYQPV